MAGIPSFPKSSNKWEKILEAKHPLIQDLIRVWDESPGYILPEWSFIRDKVKLGKLIDSMIEYEQQKKIAAAQPKVAPQNSPDDPHWEKNLKQAISTVALANAKKAESASPLAKIPGLAAIAGLGEKPTETKVPELPSSPPALPKLPPVAEEKLAKLKLMNAPVESAPKVAATENPTSIHFILLYAISVSAFILACYAIKR